MDVVINGLFLAVDKVALQYPFFFAFDDMDSL